MQPTAPATREARGSPACCREEILRRRLVRGGYRGRLCRQGPAAPQCDNSVSYLFPVSGGARWAGMMTNRRFVLAKVTRLSGLTCTSPFLLTHSLRSPKPVAPHAQDSVSASAVLSPAPLLDNHGLLLSYPSHTSQPSQRRNSQVGEGIAGAPGSGGYLPDSLEEGRPG